jgi:hypothetical protein
MLVTLLTEPATGPYLNNMVPVHTLISYSFKIPFKIMLSSVPMSLYLWNVRLSRENTTAVEQQRPITESVYQINEHHNVLLHFT